MSPFQKRCRPGRAFAQELRAYREVVPRLAAAGVRCARLLAVDEPARTLTLEHLTGRSGRIDEDPAIYGRLGDIVGVLHGLDCPEDPLPLGEAMVRRAQSWARRATALGITGHHDLPQLLQALPARQRTWCHRDLQPQNWLVDGQDLALLDFEHCRPDHPLTDVVRLEARGWSAASQAAFWRGYGVSFAPEEHQAVLGLYALQTLTWALEHDDAALVAVGREAARRAGLDLR